MAYDPELAAKLASNPHNLPPGPVLSNFDYWRARYQRQGLNAGPGAVCPHNSGTAAAQWWLEGQAHSASAAA